MLWAGATIVLVTLVAYAGSFSVPLLLDDTVTIGANPSIQHLWPLGPVLLPPPEIPSSGRPLLNLSFAMNYAIGGTAVRGYHIVNFLIHAGAALVLFGIVRRTLAGPSLRGHFAAKAPWLGAATALLWALHPLQTEAVTYLSQRAEALMGLCYLLTVYGFIRGVETPRARGWLAWSVVACVLGMMSKEVMVTAPLLVLLYDRTFVAGTFRAAWAQRRGYYLALGSTWLGLAWLMTSAPLTARAIGYGHGVTWWTYALTECGVVFRYLSLGFWPCPLVFDYGADLPPPGWVQSVGGVLLLAVLAVWTVVWLRRRSPWGFLLAWYFMILLPTSSVVPIVGQPMAESRLYLPLAAVAAAVVLSLESWGGRRILAGLLAVALGLLTARRNADYHSVRAIWADTVAKVPGSSRAHNFYGMTLAATAAGLPEAIQHYEAALRIRPDAPEVHNNLANALLRLPGRAAEALAHFETALRLKPDNADVQLNLGSLLAQIPGRRADAIACYEQALRLKPGMAEAHNNLANALVQEPDRLPEALAHFETALRLKPDYYQAHNNFGHALLRTPDGRAQAVAHFETALRLQPDYALAHLNLGLVLADLPDRRPDAIAHLETALRLRPELELARQILVRLTATQP